MFPCQTLYLITNNCVLECKLGELGPPTQQKSAQQLFGPVVLALTVSHGSFGGWCVENRKYKRDRLPVAKHYTPEGTYSVQ